jgi:predicted ATP-dependent endonuclease of OLD family
MLVGMLLRNFKNYANYHYIKVLHKSPSNLSVYIGENGVGKSAILEAADAFFNNSEWNYTKNAKRDDVAITLVFLIKKTKADTFRLVSSELLQALSDYFWDGDAYKSLNNSNYPYIQEFINHKNDLLKNFDQESYYFLVIGKSLLSKNEPHYGTFESTLTTELNGHGFAQREHASNNLIELILKLYAFVYIPVEGYAEDFLMLERREMQDLMSKDISDKIDSALNERSLTIEKEGKAKKTNVIDSVNESLDGFVDEINIKIQCIDDSYSFSVDPSKKRKLTASDVREQIIKSYFNIRTLKKDKKEISQHSSGEQRKALLDVASAFLDKNSNTEKTILLAIDEPEASMHTSSCFNQFERIGILAEHHQILVTTHWYGFLPTIQKGNLHHIARDKSAITSIKSFDFENYFEDRRTFPEDVELKSYFDFVASVLSIMKIEENNWIFCEGSDDVNYIRAHISESILTSHKIKIIPLGGIANIIKIYEYLFVPFGEKVEKGQLKGKVLCITDTDTARLPIRFASNNPSLSIKRFQLSEETPFDIALVPFDSNGTYRATFIEDAVNADNFFVACAEIAFANGKEDIVDVLGKIDVTNKTHACVFAGDDWLDSTKERVMIQDFVRAFKTEISTKYLSMPNLAASSSLKWVENIVHFFQGRKA